jgi:hypothetical protein
MTLLHFLENICRFKSFNQYPMKKAKKIVFLCMFAATCSGVSSCGFINSIFGPKYGCPSNGKNVGAERILSGEKVPKAPKFNQGF